MCSMTRILVIEDEATVRDTVQDILALENFDTLTAENGLIGLQLARHYHPDLIICDVMMPELNGHEVLSALLQDSATARIPFIFLTAKADRTDMRQGMTLGADDYLTKPFTPTELIQAIHSRLKKQTAIAQPYAEQIQQLQVGVDYLLNYNSLTQLPNQHFLEQQLAQLQTEVSLNNKMLPLLLFHLDQFDRLTEILGYEFGDKLLIAAANRLLEASTIASSIDLIAHIRNNHLALLLHPTCHETVESIAKSILASLISPFLINNHQVFLTASIGIALGAHASQTPKSLIAQAEIAVAHVRQQGGNLYLVYTPTLQPPVVRQLDLEASLRYALERHEFQVYYQPKIELQNQTIVGAEALLRWFHPQEGLISPAEFIPIAEATGLITSIGEWVLRTACNQAIAWHQAGYTTFHVAINLSALQLSQPNLTEMIVQVLTETGLDPRFLDLEITESLLMQNPQSALQILTNLKALGIRISIDDFGVGYSSLSYLQHFPFDHLKLDRCFVRNIANNPRNQTITTAVIQMAHGINLKVIAEGVEAENDLNFLQQQGCDLVQGYWFSPPVPAEQFQALLPLHTLDKFCVG